MATVGLVGIGDMGAGLAKNLLAAGFAVQGFDPKPERQAAFAALGGVSCESAAEVGAGASTVFVMVMNGAQAEAVITALRGTLAAGSVIVLTATIKPKEAVALGNLLDGSGIYLIDSPVSGGQPGAEGGSLTLMAAGPDAAFEAAGPALEAVSGTLHRVGDKAGDGQVVKACLQSLIGSIFAGAFEATALAAKAGVEGQVLFDVFSTSAAGCGITNAAVGNVMRRQFEKTGSHINTMHKDLTISLDLAMDLGVPLFTASTAMQLFQAGRTRHPDGDNQSVALITEEIIGAGLKQ